MTPQNLKSETAHKGSETSAIEKRYERRKANNINKFYSPLSPSVYMARQELERILIKDVLSSFAGALHEKTLLEVGCGNGINLLEFIKLGFLPENLTGNELLEERVAVSRHNLPKEIDIIAGDATHIDSVKNKYDIVYQSTVFTSILDADFQVKLANAMWDMVKPGGGVLWYDFIYNNPKNQDVRGVSLKRVKALFPESNISCFSTTLAPPISRMVTKIHPSLYSIFNVLPFLRSHILCWIPKPE